MTSTKLKTAYVLFLISSFVWLSVLLMVCFPSGHWPVPVRFPNSSMLMLFLGSAVVAAVSCSIIGLEYLGLDFKFRQRSKEIPQAAGLTKTIPLLQQVNAGSIEEAKNQTSMPQEEPVTVLVPQLEEEQESLVGEKRKKKK
jgi:hypothetical protein